MPRLLLISYRFPPETYPLAIGLRGVVDGLRGDGSIDVITAADPAYAPANVRVHHVPPRPIHHMTLRRARLGWLADLLTWPDPFAPWVLPAYQKAKEVITTHHPDAILTFMMPYSTGFVGVLAKRFSGLPLVFNLDDSPTCIDQNPSVPSRLHRLATEWMENLYVRSADAVVYVSQNNLERVQRRQPPEHRDGFHLIRYGATSRPPAFHPDVYDRYDLPLANDTFNIVYVGGMSGWSEFLPPAKIPTAKRLYRTTTTALRHHLTEVDHRPHGPVYVGRAVRQLVEQYPAWRDRIHVHFFGTTHPHQPVDAVLSHFGIADLVTVHPPVDHDTARALQVASDCLFMSLPARTDGGESSIISSKTYEYLQTDRPILAALPPGENATYLAEHAGVHRTLPNDVTAMADALAPVINAWMDGGRAAVSVDRSASQAMLGSDVRARAFHDILSAVAESPGPVRHRSTQTYRKAYT